MKHYFNPMSRGVSTDWMLREIGVEHEQIFIDIAKDEHYGETFKAINPMCKLPVLVDGATIVTEVAAICAYLADRFPEKGLAPELGSVERAAYYRYLFVAGNTIEPALALESAGLEHPAPRSAGWGDLERVLDTIEALTPEEGWALGEQFSAADVVFGGLLDFMIVFGLLEPTEKVAAYASRLRQRPAYRASHPAFLEMIGEG